jgi:alpha-amylase
LSDDIAFRFSDRKWAEWPLTPEKFVKWLQELPQEEEIVNLFMDYETFGEHQWEETGIFEFLQQLPGSILKQTDYTFVTPKEAFKQLSSAGPVEVVYPISWADEERDLTAWLGNDLQDDAFDRLYEMEKKVHYCKDERLLKTWRYLQTSDHFYYMCTKFFSDGDVHRYFNPYNTPYDAFINYMNVMADFTIMLDEAYKKAKNTKKNRPTGKQFSAKKKKN